MIYESQEPENQERADSIEFILENPNESVGTLYNYWSINLKKEGGSDQAYHLRDMIREVITQAPAEGPWGKAYEQINRGSPILVDYKVPNMISIVTAEVATFRAGISGLDSVEEMMEACDFVGNLLSAELLVLSDLDDPFSYLAGTTIQYENGLLELQKKHIDFEVHKRLQWRKLWILQSLGWVRKHGTI